VAQQTTRFCPPPNGAFLQKWNISLHRRAKRYPTLELGHRRDFAQGIDGSAWRAVYIGLFKVELLADAVNERWLNEECPKQRLPDDDQARMTRSRQDFKPADLSSD
jgi:hypothetical protein